MPGPNRAQLFARNGMPGEYRPVELEEIDDFEYIISQPVCRVVPILRFGSAGSSETRAE